jgi:hypothetical protein
MKSVFRGIAKHQVVMVKGDNIRDVIKEYVYPRYVHETFSAINMDLKRVESVLSSKRWDGTRPVVILFRCEPYMRELSTLIRNRQPKQAVLLVVDGEYTTSSNIMKSLVDVTLIVGKVPATIFSLLKKGPLADPSVRYEKAIECTDLQTVVDQIHYSNPDFDVSGSLSDVDILRYHVPEDICVACLPIRKSVEYTSNKQVECTTTSNLQLVQTIQPSVALTTSSLMSKHETLEYIRYAHLIATCPNIVKCPRDDPDPNYVTNVNDRIRVLVTLDNPATRNKRKRVV